MLYVKQNSGCDLLSAQHKILSSPLSSNVGTLTIGDIHKMYRYVTLRIELVPKIPIVRWETEIVRIPEPFRPYMSMYAFTGNAFIHADTGKVVSDINFEPSEGTLVIYSMYLAA